jgi:gluconolactonase
MKVDVEGNLYTTGPGGVWIYNPDGELIDRLSVPESSTNLAFGGSDMTTLYITAPPNVYRAPVTIAGVQ